VDGEMGTANVGKLKLSQIGSLSEDSEVSGGRTFQVQCSLRRVLNFYRLSAQSINCPIAQNAAEEHPQISS
jgi:hypothetical protein